MGTNQELIERARKSYRSLDGIICVSPRLVADLADALEALNADHTDSEKALIDSVNALADERDELRAAIDDAFAGYKWARDGGEALEAVMKALKGAGDVQG